MTLINMSDYNRAARVYWFTMVVLGALGFVWALSRALSFTQPQWAQLLVLLSLVVISSSRPIPIPNQIATVTARRLRLPRRIFSHACAVCSRPDSLRGSARPSGATVCSSRQPCVSRHL